MISLADAGAPVVIPAIADGSAAPFVHLHILGERVATLLAAPALERDLTTRHVRLPYGAARAESLLSVACTASAH